MRRFTKLAKTKKIEWRSAPDVKKRVVRLKSSLKLDWIKTSRIICFRSTAAKTRAYARIWGLGKIWQMALKVQAAYIIEVVAEKFDKLSEIEKDKVLLHEVTHIPRNFSGALMPHVRRGKKRFADRVHELIFQYTQQKNK